MQEFFLTKSKVLDNTQFWKENSEADYCKTIQQIIKSDPFEGHKFYIFQFVKRVDDISGVKKWYHQPRLTKPDPLPGTTLLRVDPKDPDTVTIIWTLPNEENFGLYGTGKIFGDSFVYECIQKFLHNPRALMQPEEGDVPETKMRELYKNIKMKALHKKRQKERESKEKRP